MGNELKFVAETYGKVAGVGELQSLSLAFLRSANQNGSGTRADHYWKWCFFTGSHKRSRDWPCIAYENTLLILFTTANSCILLDNLCRLWCVLPSLSAFQSSYTFCHEFSPRSTLLGIFVHHPHLIPPFDVLFGCMGFRNKTILKWH